jgi:hypothetical protein
MRFRRGPLPLAGSVLALVVAACTGTGASPAPAGTLVGQELVVPVP